MKLWLIGCGSPRPTGDRFGTCYILDVDGEYLMFDCGPATTHKMTQAGILPTSINHLFITHHHYDHIIDLPCFLLTRWYMCRGEGQLRIYGPDGTRELVTRILTTFEADWMSRMMHQASVSGYTATGGQLPRKSPSPMTVDLSPDSYLPCALWQRRVPWQVTTCSVKHYQPMLESLAYRVDTPSGSIVFTGDTYSDEWALNLAEGVDTLVATCWDFQRNVNKVPGSVWGDVEVAKFAQKSGAKHLILVHPHHEFPKNCATALVRISRIYSGEVTFGEELSCINLRRN